VLLLLAAAQVLPLFLPLRMEAVVPSLLVLVSLLVLRRLMWTLELRSLC
jgi:hypothetical protein